MKTFFYILPIIFTISKAQALPLGNPAEAGLLTNGSFFKKENVGPFLQAISFKMAYYGDFVFNRFLEAENSTHKDLDKTFILNNALYLGVNFYEKAELYALYGKSRLTVEANAESFGGINGNRFVLETNTATIWSLGGRCTVFEYRNARFGLMGQYYFSRPQIDRLTLASAHSSYPNNSLDCTYREWQIGAGVSYRLWKFSPYIGVKYSHVAVQFNEEFVTVGAQTLHLFSLKNRKPFGFACGISLIDSERMQVTLEARFWDEKAVYINRQMRF